MREIEIKKSTKLIDYESSIKLMQLRVKKLKKPIIMSYYGF